jgi:formate dehydrogenase alpha subunit
VSERSADRVIVVDGEEVAFAPGETIYAVAERLRRGVPTLCFDPRLEPFGACRLCVVELEGARNPVASCTMKAEPGMKVRTRSAALDKHRRTLLELVASENGGDVEVDPLRGYASQELRTLVEEHGARTDRFRGATSGASKDDGNPFLLRDYDKCISCYRCVRVCAEQEGDYAISVMHRGFDTQITTEFDGELRDSSCTFCGQCVQTCPTGALADRKSMRAIESGAFQSGGATAVPIAKTRTICPYCGVGCSVDLMTRDDRIVGVQPAMDGPANHGALCVKGQFAWDFVQHQDRLTTPLIRGAGGELHAASWDEALDRAAKGFLDVVREHGRHSVYGVASGRAPSEAAYLMQRWIRSGFGTNFIDNCSRA